MCDHILWEQDKIYMWKKERDEESERVRKLMYLDYENHQLKFQCDWESRPFFESYVIRMSEFNMRNWWMKIDLNMDWFWLEL